MSTVAEFKKYFAPEVVPEALVKLIEFSAAQKGWFSQGFEMEIDADDGMFSSHSSKAEFLDNLFHIGQADGTGSSYAIWRQGALGSSPIVIFGGEGGRHVVADNIQGLFRILSLDAEPMVDWEKVAYYKADDHEASNGAGDYAKWLARNFELTPVKDAKAVNALVAAAQKTHGMAFDAWVKKIQS